MSIGGRRREYGIGVMPSEYHHLVWVAVSKTLELLPLQGGFWDKGLFAGIHVLYGVPDEHWVIHGVLPVLLWWRAGQPIAGA